MYIYNIYIYCPCQLTSLWISSMELTGISVLNRDREYTSIWASDGHV